MRGRPSKRRNANTRPGYDERVVAAVLELALRVPQRRSVPLIGLSGLQGSGKSTLAAQVVAAAAARDVAALALSIDEFYLRRRERAQLARRVHPLLATRGVPGTHDITLLRSTLDAVARASPATPALVPRFDKGRDTRRPRSRWQRVTRRPAFVILEGWCIGVPPQGVAALRRPLNELERDGDPHGRWRRWVNARLALDYVPIWRRLDRLVLLQAPGFDVVARWRGEQERALRRRRAPRALTPAALRRFLMHYERLSRQALRTLPARADLRIVLDAQRTPLRIRAAAAPPRRR